MSRRGRMFLAVAIGLVLVLVMLGSIVDVLTDRLWFSEVHYSQVFSTMIWTRLVMFLVVGVLMGGIVGGSLFLAYSTRPMLRPRSAEQQALERYRMLIQPHIVRWIVAISGLIGLFAGISGQGHWQTWLLFANGGSFGVKDPEFHIDIGWYVFDYPFWRYVVSVGFTVLFLALLGALAVHYLFGGIRLQGEGERMSTAARIHVTSLVAAFVLLKAGAYVLDRRALVLDHITTVDIWGAGYTDVNALLPAKLILAWISVIVAVAILVFSNAFIRNLVWPGMALGLLALSAVAIGGIYPFAVQQFSVKPSPLQKESVYIQRSIDATRAAFGLSGLTDAQYAANSLVPTAALANDAGTVPNIRLLDPAVVADTYTALQRSRGFYDFGEKLDIDRYTTASKTQDYVVGVREIDYGSQTGQTWNWQNAHTIYTHGDGFVGAPANKTVCDGKPYFVSGVLKDQTVPQVSDTGEACVASSDQLPAAQNGIYYGEGMDAYAVVGQPAGAQPVEYDGPNDSGGDAYVTYSGTGGVSVGSYWRRILYAVKFKEPNFLISSVFNDNSKVLYVRDPRERVEKIAPFLTIDGDPYPAVINGRITWILDGYTTASTYPYSQRVDLRNSTSDAQVGAGVAQQSDENVNYLRNSVKATVDAYDGTVTLYKFGADDPVLDAWNKAFGGDLVKPSSDIPADLMAHLRYPEDQFKVQRDLLTRYHVTNAQGFYSGADFWQVPVDPAHESNGLKQPPYYVLAQFPGQSAPTFQLTSAMVRPGQPNLASLITASYDAQGNPRLQLLETPRLSGPTQVQQLMQNDPDVRKDLSLFSSTNSTVVYGNLLSLPVTGGILYVEPLYIQSTESGAYPLMKKVLLSYGDHIAYADTLDEGINQLIQEGKNPNAPPPPTSNNPPPSGSPSGTPTPPGGGSAALDAAVAQINKALADLRAAQASGNVDAYGKALTELQAATTAYEKALQATGKSTAPPQSPSPAPSPSG